MQAQLSDKLKEEIESYIPKAYSHMDRDEKTDMMSYIIVQGAISSLYIEEFKGTDGVVAFYLDMEDEILAALERAEKKYSGLVDSVEEVFSMFAIEELERLECETEAEEA